MADPVAPNAEALAKTTIDSMSGNYTLKKLKDNNILLTNQLQDAKSLQQETLKQMERLVKEKQQLKDVIDQENVRYSELAAQFAAVNKVQRTAKEAELLLSEEAEMRFRLERDNETLRKQVEHLEQCLADEFRKSAQLQESTEKDRKKIEEDKKILESLKNDFNMMRRSLRDREFDLDEVQVINIKVKRKNEELEKDVNYLRPELKKAIDTVSVLAKENDAYQSEVKTLRKDRKRLQIQVEDLTAELTKRAEEHKALEIQFFSLQKEYDTLDKAKRLLAHERDQLAFQGNQLNDQIAKLNEALVDKEKDYMSLSAKFNDAVKDFELKLEGKNDQIASLTEKLEEETQRRAQTNMDLEYFTNMERKWQEKERRLVADLEVAKLNMADKDIKIHDLTLKISQIQNSLYEPRMQRLQQLEKEMKAGIEEFAFMEEAMETGFLCPRCTKVMKVPVSLHPCGHTYCQVCVEELEEENFNKLKCQECKSKNIEAKYRNEALENVLEQYVIRRDKIQTFLKWMRKMGTTGDEK